MHLTYNLLNLLPYPKTTLIVGSELRLRILKIVHCLSNLAMDALQAFSKKQYLYFDPHVSDNLCQIRAYQFQLLFDHQNTSALSKNLENHIMKFKIIREKADLLLKTDKSNSNERSCKKKNLQEFLELNELLVELSSFEFFLITTYFLTRYRSFDDNMIPNGINYHQINQEFSLNSTTFSSKISHHLQRVLSNFSCKFVQSISNNPVISYLLKTDEIQRNVLPCYWVTKAIIDHIIKQKKSILLLVLLSNNIVWGFPLVYNEKKGRFEVNQNLKKIDNHNPFFVIQGTSLTTLSQDIFSQELMRKDITSLIHANMAQHPQFAGKKLEIFKENPLLLSKNLITFTLNRKLLKEEKLFLTHKNNAHTLGCSTENPRNFLIKHIYCSSLSELQKQFPNMHLLKQKTENAQKDYKSMIFKRQNVAFPFPAILDQ